MQSRCSGPERFRNNFAQVADMSLCWSTSFTGFLLFPSPDGTRKHHDDEVGQCYEVLGNLLSIRLRHEVALPNKSKSNYMNFNGLWVLLHKSIAKSWKSRQGILKTWQDMIEENGSRQLLKWAYVHTDTFKFNSPLEPEYQFPSPPLPAHSKAA